MITTIVLGLSIVVLLAAYVYTLPRRTNLKGPQRWPFVGNLFELKNKTTFHLDLERLCRTYGNVFELSGLGKRVVIVADAEVAHKVISSRPEGFARIQGLETLAKSVGIEGVFSSEGHTWKRQRKLTAPAFTSIQSRGHYEEIALVTNRLERKWKNLILSAEDPSQGIVLDVLPDLMSFTLDTIALIAFGYDLNSLESQSPELADALNQYLPFFHHRLMANVPYWHLYHTTLDNKFFKSNGLVRGLVYDIIQKYYDKSDLHAVPKRSFINTILAARASGEENLNDMEIFGNVITILLAGQDTTANSLAWAMYYLSRNHEKQEQLFAEVHDIVREAPSATSVQLSEKPSFLPGSAEQIDKMIECRNFIQETLRMRGASPIGIHTAKLDQQIPWSDGDKTIDVRKGDLFVLLHRDISRASGIFREFDKFNPDRWNELDKQQSSATKSFVMSLPFGGGPRICPGRHLSLFESNVFLSMLCNTFVVRHCNGTRSVDTSLAGTEDPTVKESLIFTMGPENLRIKLFIRNLACP